MRGRFEITTIKFNLWLRNICLKLNIILLLIIVVKDILLLCYNTDIVYITISVLFITNSIF